jgi:hypothetical protein
MEVAAWSGYLYDSSVFVDFQDGWAEKVHPVVAKQPIKRPDLFLGVGPVDHVLTRWQVLESAYLAEEVLHLAGGLVHVDDFGRPAAHAGPYMGVLARDENAFTGGPAQSFSANHKSSSPSMT